MNRFPGRHGRKDTPEYQSKKVNLQEREEIDFLWGGCAGGKNNELE